jgi:hypothetical protein
VDSGVKLFVSIALDELLSKGLLSAAQKGPDGRRIEVQSQGDLVIAEAVAPEDEKFRLTLRKDIQN